MFKKLTSMFRKKRKHTPLPSLFATIEFSDASKLTNAGGSNSKIIKVFKHGQEILSRRRQYNPIRHSTMLNIEEIPFVDLTDGTEHPELDWYHTHNPAFIEGHEL